MYRITHQAFCTVMHYAPLVDVVAQWLVARGQLAAQMLGRIRWSDHPTQNTGTVAWYHGTMVLISSGIESWVVWGMGGMLGSYYLCLGWLHTHCIHLYIAYYSTPPVQLTMRLIGKKCKTKPVFQCYKFSVSCFVFCIVSAT